MQELNCYEIKEIKNKEQNKIRNLAAIPVELPFFFFPFFFFAFFPFFVFFTEYHSFTSQIRC
jgi:hypothetical protein